MKKILLKVFNIDFLYQVSSFFTFFTKSKFIRRNHNWQLYKTRSGIFLWFNNNGYLQRKIVKYSVWEKRTTDIIKLFLKKGDVFIDVGANIGYMSIIASKIVGEEGIVLAFEPTSKYMDQLKMNIRENKIHNCKLFNVGLSDQVETAFIHIGESSATLHKFGNDNGIEEKIKLIKFDDIFGTLGILKIDFIKVDVDGHEFAFIKGAINNIKKFKPVMLLEVNHANYFKAGVILWEFYNYLKTIGFYIYSEDNLEEIKTIEMFLLKCGNFTHSHNILLSFNKISL